MGIGCDRRIGSVHWCERVFLVEKCGASGRSSNPTHFTIIAPFIFRLLREKNFDFNIKFIGERPYKCSLCELAFSTQTILTNHRLTHTGYFMFILYFLQSKSSNYFLGERPHVCEFCNERFMYKRQLKPHILTAHTGFSIVLHFYVKLYFFLKLGIFTKHLCRSPSMTESNQDWVRIFPYPWGVFWVADRRVFIGFAI